MPQTTLTFGDINLPEAWEIRSQISLLEPPEEQLAAPLSGKAPDKKPRANIVISTIKTTETELEDALREVIKEMAQATPNLKLEEPQAFSFSDGTAGLYIDISFEVQQGLRVVQRHAGQLQSKVFTQFICTVDEPNRQKLEPMTEIIQSYKP